MSTYSARWLKKKWLVVERKGKSPIRVTHLRYSTKKEAKKKARNLNKDYKGSGTKFLLRKKG